MIGSNKVHEIGPSGILCNTCVLILTSYRMVSYRPFSISESFLFSQFLLFIFPIYTSSVQSQEVGIYKRKHESKKTRKQDIDPESDQENKKENKN